MKSGNLRTINIVISQKWKRTHTRPEIVCLITAEDSRRPAVRKMHVKIVAQPQSVIQLESLIGVVFPRIIIEKDLPEFYTKVKKEENKQTILH